MPNHAATHAESASTHAEASVGARIPDGLSWRRIAGFACYQGFVYSVFYMGLNHELTLGPFTFERAELLLTLVFMLATFLGMHSNPSFMRKLVASRGALVTCAALMAIGSFASFVPAPLFGTAVIPEGMFLGFSMAVLLVAWGRTLGAASTRTAACEIFAATGIAGACCFLMAFLPSIAILLIPKALPLLSVAFLLFGVRGEKNAGPSARSAHDSDSRNASLAAGVAEASPNAVTPSNEAQSASLRKTGSSASKNGRRLSAPMLAGAALFGLAAGIMETGISDPGALTTPDFPATLLVLALFCIAVLQALFAQRPDERETFGSMYRIGFIVVMAGFLFAPALASSAIPGEAITLGGYLGLIPVFMALFLAMAAISGQDSSETFLKGFLAIYAGEATGIIVTNALDMAGATSEIDHLIMAFAGLAALLAYAMLFTERDFRELSAVVEEPDFGKAACQAIAQTAKLSEREAEVLSLALKGYTNDRIAKELFVAKSTADTHLRRIYAKCGVHSRQELIDLSEQTLAELKARRR